MTKAPRIEDQPGVEHRRHFLVELHLPVFEKGQHEVACTGSVGDNERELVPDRSSGQVMIDNHSRACAREDIRDLGMQAVSIPIDDNHHVVVVAHLRVGDHLLRAG